MEGVTNVALGNQSINQSIRDENYSMGTRKIKNVDFFSIPYIAANYFLRGIRVDSNNIESRVSTISCRVSTALLTP